ncbi:MAG: GNAT family N-acetyltransferase [Pirellulales bacterium]
MTTLQVTVDCPVHASFRVQQIAGLFDVPIAERASQTFHAELPDLDGDWKIGLVVGPSGSGKTTIARAAFGARLHQGAEWPADRAVIDCFGEVPGKELTALLTAVGFSSPPSWIKPYHVLSNGERFRCDLARALVAGRNGENPIVAFDEFTSVVDRNVARIGSAAIAKQIRQGRIPCRFVAVTCHYDVAEWLQPDWVLDMATGDMTRRRLRRPPIEIEVFRCHRAAWKVFARHHYLSGDLNRAARCYLATWRDVPVALCATLATIGRRNHWRVSRLVTLPDFQGVGIGTRLAETVAELHRRDGHRVGITASHPAVIGHCRRSPRWRAVRWFKTGFRKQRSTIGDYRSSAGRAVVSFEYVGPRPRPGEDLLAIHAGFAETSAGKAAARET